jgi:LmbE family N-acetylglucosaminyl deacetylase
MRIDREHPPNELGTILGVWAHPDDEAYLSAGLMALARANGQRVVVATATAGERGTPDPDRWGPERLGALRRHEMAASMAALGVREHRWFGWADGGVPAVGADAGVSRIAALIDEVRPDTIVTFGPDGITGHPDHRAIPGWTLDAWARSGRRARLLFACVTQEFLHRWDRVNGTLGVFADAGPPPPVRPHDLGARVVCDDALLDQKLVALRAHASQTLPIIDLVGEDAFRRWWEVETFVDAHRVARPAARPAGAAGREPTHRHAHPAHPTTTEPNRGADHAAR